MTRQLRSSGARRRRPGDQPRRVSLAAGKAAASPSGNHVWSDDTTRMDTDALSPGTRTCMRAHFARACAVQRFEQTAFSP
eukprot:2872663-Rhodomonas_salina.1